jgi:hypothetical protein
MSTGIVPAIGRPGISAAVTAQKRNVSRDGHITYFPGNNTIEGTKSRDPGNSAHSVRSLRAGLLMGKITSGGFWAPSILGVTTVAYTSGGTELTVSAASAVEIARRVGSTGTGTLKAIGPPTAAGTNATTSITFSAVDTTTGVLTVTSLGVDKIAGTFITAADGSEVPRSFISDGYGVLIPEDSSDVSYPFLPISCIVDTAQIIDWPSDETLRAYIRHSLSTLAGGKFVFSDQFTA